MSDYRDILLKALKEGKTMDSCGLDERYYDFGLYTDLCGMSVEDAIKSVTQCCCGGGGSNTGGTKTNNPITISAEKNTDNKYVVKVKAAYATTAPVIVSFTIDGQSVTATIPAGASEASVDGVVLDTQYATIGKIEIATTDEVYKYTAVSSIADGLFVLTYKIDGKTVHELKIKAGSKIEKFEPEAKTGYLFKGWVPAEPETMPEKDTTLEGTYEAIPYYIVFKDETTGDIRVECFYQSEIKKPNASEKKGHDFQGWFMADGNEVPDVLNFIPDGDVEATPKYEPRTYTLTYQTYDGQAWKTASVKYDAVIVYEADGPARVGYDFTGWDNKPENNRMPDSDVILKALYEIHKWNLIYSLQDDENPDFTGVTFENVEYNAEITTKTTTFAEEHKTAEGKYVFSWDGTEHETTNMPDSNLTIRAIRKVVEHTLTFVDAEGTVYSSITQNYGTAVNLTIEPTKEGYTFTGWDKGTIPTTMPAEDMTFVSQFDINKHTVNFVIANEKDAADTGITILNVAYGTELAATMDDFKQKYPNVEGEYQFSWVNEESIPSTMPDENVTISAKYEAVEHTLTFMSDGAEYKKITGKFNTPIEKFDNPTKTGYEFTKWDEEVPERFPNADKTFTAQFTIKQYTVTINDEEGILLKTVSVDYNTAIATIESPVKEGYTFVEYTSAEGYTNVPDKDITIVAKYQINVHKVTYFVDDVKVHEQECNYHATIAEYNYTKEGYTISAWVGLPDDMLMPDKDLEIRATSTVNEYNVTFNADGKVYEAKKVAYGAAITVPTVAPTKTGYTFKQWIGVPETMPAQDVVIEAEFTINSYSLTFKNGTDVVTAFTVEYGAALDGYASQAMALVPAKDGFTFSWDSAVPATMPAEDVVVEGSYKEKQAGVAYYGVIKTGTTIDENSIKQLDSCPESDFEGEGKDTPLVIPSNEAEYMAAKKKWSEDMYPYQEQLDNDEITQEEFDEAVAPIEAEFQKYKDNNLYTLVFAIASGATIIFKNSGHDDTADWIKKSINIDDANYDVYTLDNPNFYAVNMKQNVQHTIIKN